MIAQQATSLFYFSTRLYSHCYRPLSLASTYLSLSFLSLYTLSIRCYLSPLLISFVPSSLAPYELGSVEHGRIHGLGYDTYVRHTYITQLFSHFSATEPVTCSKNILLQKIKM
ncbi:hypothetical protein BCR43DRAFT_333971 [Syncephalastrum racemosum]|uniref:Uncharacterized protein n=1 Tax=Syncephalastrum racemosum TaxID=13706 RepID=A0A1X2H8F8_SYNRA|nr:hypothetical protein BCR43DRAFT_333971 [Syncephalastrum racemosum]